MTRREALDLSGEAAAMRQISTLATVVGLACAACQPVPDANLAAPPAGEPQPAPTASTQPPAAPPACNSYTVPVTVGGQPQQATVEACQQADGSWRITQTTPGLPPQVYEVPPPAYFPYPSAYPYLDFYPDWGWADWGWAGDPWFFGLAPSIVVVQRFNHFHHGFAHGFGHGFARGFGHGFGHGFAGGHGFGHGFAGGRGGGMAGGHR
jgi:hypothetical protein